MLQTNSPKVAIIMGSDSDLKVMKDAAAVLEEFNVPYMISVVSAHRTPERAISLTKNAAQNGIRVIIAGAGGAAHLAGVVAAFTHLPVIAVPILTKSMGGVDSLYSMVQMPPGIPVATVAINGALNAGLLAIQILATDESSMLSKKMIAYKLKMKNTVEAKANELEEIGYKEYLKKHE